MEGRQLTLEDKIVDARDSLNNTWYKVEETIYLKLASEDKNRILGKVKGDIFFCKRIRDKHLFRQNSSYAFNINIIEQLGVNYIELYEDSGIFKFPVDVLRQYGEYLHFKSEGFERQLFLSLSIIDKWRFTPEMDDIRVGLMGQEWYNVLKPEFEKEYMQKLGRWINQRRKEVKVFPDRDDTFKALKKTPFSKIKVLILGQDPYNTLGVADGLAFSSKLPTYIPPSLYKIFDAIEVETGTLNLDRNPQLDRWAEQGVLLFNTILTVEQNQPKSHAKIGWEIFTNQVLLGLKNHSRNLVVFLWGRDAQDFRLSIDNGRHLILEAEHPAAAAWKQRAWENNNCFTKANMFLQLNGMGAIEW